MGILGFFVLGAEVVSKPIFSVSVVPPVVVGTAGLFVVVGFFVVGLLGFFVVGGVGGTSFFAVVVGLAVGFFTAFVAATRPRRIATAFMFIKLV